MHRWKPTDSTGFLELLAPKGKFVEVGVADIEKIKKGSLTFLSVNVILPFSPLSMKILKYIQMP